MNQPLSPSSSDDLRQKYNRNLHQDREDHPRPPRMERYPVVLKKRRREEHGDEQERLQDHGQTIQNSCPFAMIEIICHGHHMI